MDNQTLISSTESFKTLPWHWHRSPAVAAGKCAAECVYKWGTPLWTSVRAGRGLTVNCMCRMGHSRRHNYTNPLLISGSVGKLTRNDARDVASPRNPNKKHSPALETESYGPGSPKAETGTRSVSIRAAAGDDSRVALLPTNPSSCLNCLPFGLGVKQQAQCGFGWRY